MKKLLMMAGTIALLATPVMAQSGAASGAAAGAVGGAVVGGPVGAAVGGVTGAIVGGALSGPDETRVREYVVKEKHPSVRVQEDVKVGAVLPGTVKYYEIPSSVGVKTTYRYAVVNDRTVLVDPSTRKVIQIIE